MEKCAVCLDVVMYCTCYMEWIDRMVEEREQAAGADTGDDPGQDPPALG
jgi:hypothetical protein